MFFFVLSALFRFFLVPSWLFCCWFALEKFPIKCGSSAFFMDAVDIPESSKIFSQVASEMAGENVIIDSKTKNFEFSDWCWFLFFSIIFLPNQICPHYHLNVEMWCFVVPDIRASPLLFPFFSHFSLFY